MTSRGFWNLRLDLHSQKWRRSQLSNRLICHSQKADDIAVAIWCSPRSRSSYLGKNKNHSPCICLRESQVLSNVPQIVRDPKTGFFTSSNINLEERRANLLPSVGNKKLYANHATHNLNDSPHSGSMFFAAVFVEKVILSTVISTISFGLNMRPFRVGRSLA